MSKATEDKLAELHRKVADKLVKMVESPEATPQDIAQAIKFLKDNNIAADLNHHDGLQELKDKIDAHTLPFPSTRSN